MDTSSTNGRALRTPYRKTFTTSVFYLILLLLLSAAKCSSPSINTNNKIEIKDLEKAVATLDKGITTLGSESANWLSVLQNIQKELTEDAQSTISNEITNLIHEGGAITGVEVRCNADFARRRVHQQLIDIRNRWAEKVKISPLPTKAHQPVVCQVVPNSIDLSLAPDRRKLLKITGYDFNAGQIKVLLKNNRDQEVDVSRSLDPVSNYELTLNLGSNGIQPSPESERLIVKVNDEQISSIGIIQPSSKSLASDRVRLAYTFGYAKNSRLVATGKESEPMEGHINWARGQSPSTVNNEILFDIRQAQVIISQSPSAQSCEAFGYLKNASLTLLRNTTEPHSGHVQWCKDRLNENNWGAVVQAVEQEFINPMRTELEK